MSGLLKPVCFEGPVIVGHDEVSQQFCQPMTASLKIGGRDALIEMLVFWRNITTEDSNDVELQQLTVIAAEVDGIKLSEEQLDAFCSANEDAYMGALEWIALSSIDLVEVCPS